MSEPRILLISHGNFEPEFLEEIAGNIKTEYHFPVYIEGCHLDLSEFYDPMRRQYDGNKILKALDAQLSPCCEKKLGLFRVDLFIPILTYIFGQAALNGSTGIASLYRLRNEQYGMKRDDRLLLERLIKVIIHELGHMFGLLHCVNPVCVMRSSTYVEDIDQKGNHLCPKCRGYVDDSRVQILKQAGISPADGNELKG